MTRCSLGGEQGGRVVAGGGAVEGDGHFVQATLVEIDPSAPVVAEELFAPVLYVMQFEVTWQDEARETSRCKPKQIGCYKTS